MTDKTKKNSGQNKTDFRQRLFDLRTQMKKQGIDAYLVPRADEWQGEYVPACAERLTWLTGFTGSAGFAAVTAKKAAVFSDSRYTIQLKNQLDSTLYDGVTIKKTDHYDWLAKNLKKGAMLGYDPRLHTVNSLKKLEKAMSGIGIHMKAIDGNLVDAAWLNRPDFPDDEVENYPIKYAGKSFDEKRELIAQDLKDQDASAFILTAPDSIAWLLNIRGKDVPNTPFALSYAIIHDDGHVDWFIDSAKVPQDVRKVLGNHVTIEKPDALENALKSLKSAKNKILLDPDHASTWFESVLNDALVTFGHETDPVMLRKALKNDTEIKAIEDAHIQDGAALVKFWKWVSEEAPKEKLSELDVENHLFKCRQTQKDFRENSFDPIVGWAANGAIVHYRATPENHSKIKGSGLLLVDSGAQYHGGTTDNTRTMAIGKPTKDMKDSFTRVLKGHIGVASSHFPKGTTGREIDILARHFLRKAGKDYGHGTGHGVGQYLSVHEAGAGISTRFDKPLKPGMFISNEPGYYKEGAYGIRLENLVFVEEDPNDPLMLRFNTVSLTPFDRTLIDTSLLDADERDWIDEYHKRVFDTLKPYLHKDEVSWLKKQTAPLPK